MPRGNRASGTRAERAEWRDFQRSGKRRYATNFWLTTGLMHTLAAHRGGEFLSPHYQTRPAKLEWRCAKGHVFFRSGSEVKWGRWCETCRNGKGPLEHVLTIEQMREAARRRGGACLSERYVAEQPLLWRCAEGHTWRAIGIVVRGAFGRGGSWCPRCGHRRGGEKIRLPIESLRQIALRRGGRLLSESPQHRTGELLWRCAKGHEWWRAGTHVKSGHWCPECSPTKRLEIEHIAAIARKRGGRCLSKTYDPKRKIELECSKGHRWRTAGSSISQGHWCHRCMGSGGVTLVEVREIVAKRSGTCLSTRYVPGRKIAVKCGAGHRFEMIFQHLRTGHWCPECAGKIVRIETLQRVARERGGELLSARYRGAFVKLRWRCANGHVWRAAPGQVKFGSWCPACAIARRSTRRKISEP